MKRNYVRDITYMSMFVLIALLIVAVLPVLGAFDTEKGILILFAVIFFTALLLTEKSLYEKGNLSQYDINKFTVLWKEQMPPVLTASKKTITMLITLFLIGSSIIVLYLLNALPRTPADSTAGLLLGLVFIIGIMCVPITAAVLILFAFRYKLRRYQAQHSVVVYNEGLQVRKTYVPWTEITVINTENKKMLSQIKNKMYYLPIKRLYVAPEEPSTTIIINTKKDTVLMTTVNNIPAFQSAVKRAGKESLIRIQKNIFELHT